MPWIVRQIYTYKKNSRTKQQTIGLRSVRCGGLATFDRVGENTQRSDLFWHVKEGLQVNAKKTEVMDDGMRTRSYSRNRHRLYPIRR